jgi:pilus assembly protein CpaB
MNRFAFVFVVALLIAAGASFLLFRVVGANSTHAAAPAPPTSTILLASRDLQVGAVIADGDLSTGKWLGDPPQQAARKKEEIVGRGVVSTIYQGEPIWLSRIAVPGAGAGLAATIPNGKRAIALRVNEVIGLAGFVLPGMHVDVIAAAAPPAGAGNSNDVVSRTILQNIEVLSAGQKLERSTDGKPVEVQVVNLLVSPAQAEALSLANSETKVQLVLRNPLDEGEKPTPGSALHSLLVPGSHIGGSGPAPPGRPAAPHIAGPVLVVEVYHGGKKTEESFPLRELSKRNPIAKPLEALRSTGGANR